MQVSKCVTHQGWRRHAPGQSTFEHQQIDAISMAAADCTTASIAQLAERTLRKRTVVGSIPTGGFRPTIYYLILPSSRGVRWLPNK